MVIYISYSLDGFDEFTCFYVISSDFDFTMILEILFQDCIDDRLYSGYPERDMW